MHRVASFGRLACHCHCGARSWRVRLAVCRRCTAILYLNEQFHATVCVRATCLHIHVLQVRREGWGSLCRPDADNLPTPALVAAASYSDAEANILCKQAGFKAGAVAPPPPVPETTRLRPQFGILYRDCKGDEASVFDCSTDFLDDPDFYIFEDIEYCDHYHDVAAACGNAGNAGALTCHAACAARHWQQTPHTLRKFARK
jgi:hypothetical protein